MEAKLLQDQQELHMFNHYVASHPNGDVLQTSYWGELKANTGWQALPLAVLDQGQIKGTALILKRQLPLLGKCIFYSPRGPVFSNTAALQGLIKAGKKLAKEHQAIFWKMDPPLLKDDPQWEEITDQLVQVPTGLDFAGVQPKFVMTLDISPPLDVILGNMKSKTRYNIRYANRQKVKVRISQNKEDLKVFYPLLQETAERDRFTIRSYQYFEDLWDTLVTRKVAQLFIVYHQEQALGGAIAFRLGKRAWYVYGASSNEKRNLQANYALQWEMIRWAKSFSCLIYDFRGVSGNLDPANPLYGLYRFKSGFDAQLIEYVGEYDLPISNVGYKLWQISMPVYQKITNRGRV